MVWFTALFAIALGIIFFSTPRSGKESPTAAEGAAERSHLENLEDSVYLSRRVVRWEQSGRQRYRGQTPVPASGTGTSPQALHNGTGASRQALHYRRAPLRVDLNAADTLTLQLLHGIGPTFARRIVRYRERLGGFVDREQLLEVYGMTPELVAHIAGSLTLDSTHVRRMKINVLPLKELLRHPYMDYYLARDVVKLRRQGVTLRDAEMLRTLPTCSDSVLQRLLPYLDFSIEEERESGESQ